MELHTRAGRDALGMFLVEGEQELRLAKEILVLYYTERTPFIQEIEKKAAETVIISSEILQKISYRGGNALAICPAKHPSLEEIQPRSLLLACEAIEKPGNLGGMLRTAVSAGIDGCIVTDPIVDIFHPNVVRASLGALFCLPIVQTETNVALVFLKQQAIQIVVATPHAQQLYYDIDFRQPTCIVVGSESQGLSSLWLQEPSAIAVKIPMHGAVDSLNVSISASILLYEAIRQRNSLSR